MWDITKYFDISNLLMKILIVDCAGETKQKYLSNIEQKISKGNLGAFVAEIYKDIFCPAGFLLDDDFKHDDECTDECDDNEECDDVQQYTEGRDQKITPFFRTLS